MVSFIQFVENVFLLLDFEKYFIFSGCLMSKIQLPAHQQNVLKSNTNVQINFDIFYAPLSISLFVSAFPPSLSSTVCTSRCAVTTGDLKDLVIFKEDYPSFINNFYLTKRYIPSLFGTKNIMAILHLRIQYYLVLSLISRNITFDII